ncbi:MAG: peptidase [Nitrosopumilus sp.]|nr:peptidase [Nitrosopumilus sp.]MDH3737212.1 peptidase [Nitrosopumilus sp.]MDH3823204.1 peptidase [Nitrosopumilus sp.]MDH3834180.1 peptidase [Nitrosopumilus sp.]
MLDRKFFLLVIFSIVFLIPITYADASSNPNLDVSAENSQFDNYFSGSMVVEVVIRDNNIRDTDEGKGEPDVTLNGKTLRMVQATDGNWYAYFANIDIAKAADSTVGLPGKGLDFGSICTAAEGTTTIGVDLNDADGVAYPYDSCTGVPNDSNNTVRKAKSPNPLIPEDIAPGSDGLGGQIGIVEDTWPFIQLFSFDNVTIQYNPGGEAQRVDLEYDEIQNISLTLDRELYPRNSEVFVVANDFQLNQDPTDEDSWTFSVISPTATFYQAFDNSGNKDASGTSGLVNLIPHLSDLDFENNGILSMDLNSVMELKPNSNQDDDDSVDDGGLNSFNQIVTLVEKGPNSGIFESFDSSDESTIGILSDASRGQAGSIEYNDESISILTGFSTGSVNLQEPDLQIGGSSTTINPGTKIPVILVDPDQNFNSGSQDDLDVFRDTSLIPTLKIGNPITLKSSSDVKFYSSSTDPLNGGNNAISSIDDIKSERLFIDTSSLGINNFEKISLNLGVSSSQFQSILINDSSQFGTNWLNYDLRSFQRDFDVNDFADTTIMLYFDNLSDPSPITIVDSGDLSSSQGFLRIDDSDIQSIFEKDGSVFVVINFDSSDNTSPIDVGSIPSLSSTQPIIFDFFSFGLENNNDGINNSIYRFELEETSDNSSTFEGTFEFAVSNQLNILDDNFIESIQPIDDDIKFIVTDRMVDEEGISISYSDLDEVGLTVTKSTQSDIRTHSGFVSTNSNSYRFGQSVTVILNDPDLNLKSDRIDVYSVIDDRNSPFVDTVGSNGQVLLEILIKDVRYKRCTINGVEHGGLASTGFRLIETGPDTGIFKGVFNMPSQICNKSGTELISPAGGSIELKYHDSRDSSGESNIFSLLNNRQSVTSTTNFTPQLSVTEIKLPSRGLTSEIILSGSINNQKGGVPLSLVLLHPDGTIQKFNAGVTNSGNYRTIFTINSSSPVGTYFIDLDYNGARVGSVSFDVIGENIPIWIKNNAKSWSSNTISDSEFIDGLEYLIEVGIITPSSVTENLSNQGLPEWMKNNAKWWTDNRISDEDFVKSIQYLINKSIIRI